MGGSLTSEGTGRKNFIPPSLSAEYWLLALRVNTRTIALVWPLSRTSIPPVPTQSGRSGHKVGITESWSGRDVLSSCLTLKHICHGYCLVCKLCLAGNQRCVAGTSIVYCIAKELGGGGHSQVGKHLGDQLILISPSLSGCSGPLNCPDRTFLCCLIPFPS